MTKKTEPKSGSEIFVPLNMLKKSPRNVRKVEHTAAEIEGLAASIGANGMLQTLWSSRNVTRLESKLATTS